MAWKHSYKKKVVIRLANETKYKVPVVSFKKMLTKAENIIPLALAELSVALVSEKQMQEINHSYRNKDEPTDVLSFNYGEIVLCPSYAKKKYSLQNKKQLAAKLKELFVHGLVHIAGQHHKTKRAEAKMLKLEEKVLK